MIEPIFGPLRQLRIALFHRLFPGVALRRAIGREKERELELRLLPALVDSRRVAIDVGANVGLYAASLAPLCAHVIAIEPHPRLARIVGSLPRNKVTVHRAIASRVPGRLEHLHVDILGQVEADALGYVSANPRRPGSRRFTAPTIALDEFTDWDVGFVKVDVEGYEFEVLSGSEALMASRQPIFLVEAESRHRASAPDDIFAFFEERNYAGFFARNGAMHPIRTFSPELQDVSKLEGYHTREGPTTSTTSSSSRPGRITHG